MADFVWADFYDRAFLHADRKAVGEKLLPNYPALKEYFEKLGKEFQTYFDTRPKSAF